MTATDLSARPLPRTAADLAAHLADGHRQARIAGRPNRGELEAEHWHAHDGGGVGHVHDWSRWGRGIR
jgi:hypothetical protein